MVSLYENMLGCRIMFGSLKSCFKKGSAHLAVNLGSWNGDGCLVAEVTFVSENKDEKKEKKLLRHF